MTAVVFAAGTSPTLVASIIGAVGAVTAALVLGYVAIRAQSASAQQEAIRRLLDSAVDELYERIHEELHETLDAGTRALVIANALRQVLGEHGGRRWYDPDS